MIKRDIGRHTRGEPGETIAHGAKPTHWSRVDALADKEIEKGAQQDPDASIGDATFRQSAELLHPKAGKQRVTLRLDAEVLDWFRSGGKGYQTRINAVLRAFMRARRPGVGLPSRST